VDIMGNLLSVVVHVANIHDTKSGILPARKHLKNIHLFVGSAPMPGTAKRLSRIFPENWALGLIFHRVSSRNEKSCQNAGL